MTHLFMKYDQYFPLGVNKVNEIKPKQINWKNKMRRKNNVTWRCCL